MKNWRCGAERWRGYSRWGCVECDQFLARPSRRRIGNLYSGKKDAKEEFNVIHPPDVVGNYAPDAATNAGSAGGGSGERASVGQLQTVDLDCMVWLSR